jgi:hypothetical protein
MSDTGRLAAALQTEVDRTDAEPTIDIYASDPDVPGMLQQAFRQATLEARVESEVPWDELSPEWQAVYRRQLEIFAGLVGWDQ